MHVPFFSLVFCARESIYIYTARAERAGGDRFDMAIGNFGNITPRNWGKGCWHFLGIWRSVEGFETFRDMYLSSRRLDFYIFCSSLFLLKLNPHPFFFFWPFSGFSYCKASGRRRINNHIGITASKWSYPCWAVEFLMWFGLTLSRPLFWFIYIQSDISDTSAFLRSQQQFPVRNPQTPTFMGSFFVVLAFVLLNLTRYSLI